jgi:hypothetical protein
MSVYFDVADDVKLRKADRLGTRFRVFPQPRFIAGYERPETIWVSVPRGTILPGPADDRIQVKDPLLAKLPYQDPYLPPFVGDVYPPAEAGPDGHFDQIDVQSRQFVAAHVYACVRRIIDIFESYLGQRIPWHFRSQYERLEIIPFIEWNNAHSGQGFMELGYPDVAGSEAWPFALNFDVIAHETGHLILLGLLGPPSSADFASSQGSDFLAYHESIADLVSKLSLLHFDAALDLILRRSRGNLYIMNELDRIGEVSSEKQLRMASHSLKMPDVGVDAHDRSRPFTGAVFDTLVAIFQSILFERGLTRINPLRFYNLRFDVSGSEIEKELAMPSTEYEMRHYVVKSALEEARDLVGEMLTTSWSYINPSGLVLSTVASAIVFAAERGRAARFAELVYDNFKWRQII